ncbi:MAG: glycerophosphodiester phosphodiesterase family protein [Pseudomonadota bacterium]
MWRNLWTMTGVVMALSACSPSGESQTDPAGATELPKTLIIAHRGASGLYPEHTLEAYSAAIDMGADFIEPDLVMTRDGVLVARHERYLSETTDVANRSEFLDRRTIKEIGGSPREDWYVEDFTLTELKSLRARQPRQSRDQGFNDQFSIPTFTEILGLVAITNQSGQRLGVYPELKSPAYFASIGLDMESALLDALMTAELDGLGAPVFIQCFDPATLRSLNEKTDWPLVQLLPATTAERLTPDTISTYADGIGPWKQVMMRFDGGPERYLALAHEAGLVVHPYTYRADDVAGGYESFDAELSTAFTLGVDGVFTDHPGQALAIRGGSD